MTPRVLIHVQHLLGTGHLRRIAVIGAALAADGMDVEIVSGGPAIPGLDVGAAELTQLPPLRTRDASFKHLIDETGALVDEGWKVARRDLLLDRLQALKPQILMTELFPFGRRVLEFELLPLLEAARAMTPRPLILCSLRDVLVAPRDAAKVDRAITRTKEIYDRVLVHGDPTLIDLPSSFPAAASLGAKIVYTGYISSPPGPDAPAGDGADEIVVSAGGSAVGAKLLEAAVAAQAAGAEPQRRWRLLYGPDLPGDARERLRRASSERVIVETARADFAGLLRRCHVSVSQAGYNTAMDVLDAQARAVFVPFATPGETEQTQRAAALAARGWAQVLSERELTPASLAAAIARASAVPRPNTVDLKRDGATGTARLVRELLARRGAA